MNPTLNWVPLSPAIAAFLRPEGAVRANLAPVPEVRDAVGAPELAGDDQDVPAIAVLDRLADLQMAGEIILHHLLDPVCYGHGVTSSHVMTLLVTMPSVTHSTLGMMSPSQTTTPLSRS